MPKIIISGQPAVSWVTDEDFTILFQRGHRIVITHESLEKFKAMVAMLSVPEQD